jgi:hypothetical protein
MQMENPTQMAETIFFCHERSEHQLFCQGSTSIARLSPTAKLSEASTLCGDVLVQERTRLIYHWPYVTDVPSPSVMSKIVNPSVSDMVHMIVPPSSMITNLSKAPS